MTIWVSGEFPLFNFRLLDILCAWIGLSFEKLWPFEFLESICCSITNVSVYYAHESDIRMKSSDHFNFSRASGFLFRASRIYDAPELDIRVKSYDHLIFSRATVVQFRASRYIMRLNRTSVWKVMTIWISRLHPLFNFERLDMWYAWIGPSCVMLWPF